MPLTHRTALACGLLPGDSQLPFHSIPHGSPGRIFPTPDMRSLSSSNTSHGSPVPQNTYRSLPKSPQSPTPCHLSLEVLSGLYAFAQVGFYAGNSPLYSGSDSYSSCNTSALTPFLHLHCPNELGVSVFTSILPADPTMFKRLNIPLPPLAKATISSSAFPPLSNRFPGQAWP